MFKIEGTALEHTPRKIDFDALEFATDYEATEYIKSVLLPADSLVERGLYYLDKDQNWYYEVTGEREWSFDSINPCKSESGELGEKIHNFVTDLHWKWKRLVSPDIKCHCCREVNYRFLKYGVMLSIIPFLPTVLTFAGGFLLVVIALASRLIL